MAISQTIPSWDFFEILNEEDTKNSVILDDLTGKEKSLLKWAAKRNFDKNRFGEVLPPSAILRRVENYFAAKRKVKADAYNMHRKKTKSRDLERKKDRLDKCFFDHMRSEVLLSEDEGVSIEYCEENTGFSKREKQAFRAWEKKMKARKKELKKQRRKERMAVAESGILSDVAFFTRNTAIMSLPIVLKHLGLDEENKFIVDTVMLALGILTSRDSLQTSIQVYLFNRLNNRDDLDSEIVTVNVMLSAFATYRSKNKEFDKVSEELAQAESASNFIKKLSDTGATCISSEGFVAFRNLLITAATYKFFNKDIGTGVFALLGKPIKGMSIALAIITCLKSLASVIQMVELYWQGAPLSTIFTMEDPVGSALREYHVLMQQVNLIYWGVPRPIGVSAHHWTASAVEIVDTMRFMIKDMSRMAPKYVELTGAIADLEGHILAHRKRIASMSRIPPLGFCIPGPPKIGKSSLLTHIVRALARAMGEPYRPSMLYKRNLSTEYWDDYDEFSHPFIHYSEVGRESDDMAYRSSESAFTEILEVIDRAPMSLNCANLHLKGEKYMNAKAVLIDTNNEMMHADKHFIEPAAPLRRFIFIKAKLKKEAKTNGGIDTNKAAQLDGGCMNAWKFTIRTYHPKTGGYTVHDEKVKPYRGETDIDALTRIVMTLYIKHIEENDRVNNMTEEASEASIDKVVEDFRDDPFMGPKLFDDYRPFNPLLWDSDSEEKEDSSAELEEEEGSFSESNEAGSLPTDFEEKNDLIPLNESGRWVNRNGVFRFEEVESDSDSDLDEKLYLDEEGNGVTRRDFKNRNRTSLDHYADASTDLFTRVRGNLSTVHDALPTLDLRNNIRATFFNFFSLMWCMLKVTDEGVGVISEFTRLTCMATSYILFNFTWGRVLPAWTLVILRNFHWTMFVGYFIGICSPIACIFTFMLRFWARGGLMSMAVRATKGEITHRVMEMKKSYRSYCDNMNGVFKVRNFLTGSSVIVVTSILVAYHYYKKRKNDIDPVLNGVTESTTFKEKSSYNDPINEIENDVTAGQSVARYNIKGTKIWNSKEVVVSVHTSSLEDLSKAVNRNVRIARLQHGERTLDTHILGVKGSYALISTHALPSDEFVVMEVTCKASEEFEYCTRKKYTLNRNKFIHVTDDLSLVYLTALLFKDIVKHFPVDKHSFDKCRAMINGDCVTATYNDGVLKSLSMTDDVLVYNGYVSYDWPEHKRGECGKPLVGERDRGCCILGIHSAAMPDSNAAFSKPVYQDELVKVIEKYDPVFEAYSESKMEIGSDPNNKSFVRYEYLGPIIYYGSFGPTMIKNKSRLRKTIYHSNGNAGVMYELFYDLYDFIPSITYTKPLLEPTKKHGEYLSPYNVAVRKFAFNKVMVPEELIRRAVDNVASHLIRGLENKGLEKNLAPLDMETAMNGSRFDAYLRRMDMSKSSGHGRKGCKRNYCTVTYDGEFPIYEADDSLKKDVYAILTAYKNKVLANPVFTSCLKDEPRDKTKVDKGKTRPFCVSPLPFLIVQRMFLAPLYTLLNQYGDVFCTAIGVDMLREGGNFFKELEYVKGEKSLMLEGDFGGYDTSMPVSIGEAANAVELRILKHFGYTDKAIDYTQGVLSDGLYPVIEMISERMRIPGYQPSGKYGTAEDNSIRNLIIQNIVWIVNTGDVEDMFEYTKPRCLGDDLLSAVHPKYAKTYNALTFQRTCYDVLKMEFTSASKGEIEDPFVDYEVCTLVKRSLRYHEYAKRHVAALDMESIFKTFQWYIPSGSESMFDQMSMTATSMAYELFLHSDDEKTFSKFFDTVKNIYYNETGIELRVPAYDDICETLWPTENEGVSGGRRLNLGLDLEDDLSRDCTQVASAESLLNEVTSCSTFGRVTTINYTRPQFFRLIELYEEEIERCLEEKKEADYELSKLEYPREGYSLIKIRKTPEYMASKTYREEVETYAYWFNKSRSMKVTLKRLRYAKARMLTFDKPVTALCESDLKPSTSIDPKVIDTYENVVDVGGDTTVDVGSDEKTSLDTAAKWHLSNDDFFSRPIKIAEITQAVGTSFDSVLDVWKLYTDEPSVRAKLRNWTFLRANLNLRFKLVGSPYHYGWVLSSVQPFHLSNKTLNFYSTAPSSLDEAYLNYLSQSKERVTMSLNANKPVDIETPFICPKQALRLFNATNNTLLATEPYDDMVGLMGVYIKSINTIRSASTTPTSVTMLVYAWLSNVQLGVPTGTVIEVEAESKWNDERETGPVENITSAASTVLSSLETIPIIRPYAKASKMMVDGMGSLASIYGFSKPPLEALPNYVKNEPFRNGANVIGVDTLKKLTLDPKQELTVDPRIVGTSEDEMAINTISSRESYLTSFAWNNSETPFGTPIFSFPVMPTLSKKYNVLTEFFYQPTALAGATIPFDNWRGKIIFRLEIACSAFHRGNFAILYEPNVSQALNINSDLDLNKQYIRIIDIQETTNVSFCIDWAFFRDWARVHSVHNLTDMFALNSALLDFANGYVSIFPVTKLQSPDSSSIYFNLYISCPDLKVNRLTKKYLPPTLPVVESAMSELPTTCLDLNPTNLNIEKISEEFFGETPVTFRNLLKRYSQQGPSHSATTGAPHDYAYFNMRLYPEPNPTWDFVAANANHLYDYLRYAYVGMRGGTRRRVYFHGSTFSRQDRIMVTLYSPETTDSTTYLGFGSWGNGTSTSMEGAVMYYPSVNAGIEVEIPFYSNNSFVLSFSDDTVGNNNFDPNYTRRIAANVITPIAAATDVRVQSDFAVAEDFSFLRFQGFPIRRIV